MSIKSIELSRFPGMSKGYVTVVFSENKTVTVPAIEVGKRFEYNNTLVTINGNATEEFFFMDNTIVASRILGNAKDFMKYWHAPEKFDTMQVIALDR